MEIMILFVRTILIYFVVFLMLKMMGKREIGKLSLFDLVISIMIAEIAVFVLEDTGKPIIEGLIPMMTLVLIQILIAYLSLKNQKLRLLFDGKPSLLIENGKLNRKEMTKQRYNLDDLLVQLRQNKVMNVADVEFALLEPSGKLSIVEKQKNRETNSDEVRSVHDSFRYAGLPLSLIMDGKVQDDNLVKLEKTRFWLKNQLQAKGVFDFKEVFFCSIDHRGNLFIDRKR